jgi:hypothetical protein
VVVEAAGNGQMNLDAARYNGRFVSPIDSGAILVGAGGAGDQIPACFTNFGSRLDTQGWGAGVATTGYGVLRANGGDPLQWYTTGFSGTSSASPIVTGAVGLVQSIRRQMGLAPLSSNGMRSLLKTTGTPQAGGGAMQIGTQPNLRAALAATLPDAGSIASVQVPHQMTMGVTQDVVVTVRNDSGATWSAGTKRIRASLGTSAGWAGVDVVIQQTDAQGTSDVRAILAAPATLGNYNLRLSLVDASNGSVLATSPNYAIRVVANNNLNALVTMRRASKNLRGENIGDATSIGEVTFKNTGTSTWRAGGSVRPIAVGNGVVAATVTSTVLTQDVPPQGAVTMVFEMQCRNFGSGGWFAQMSSAGQRFGESASGVVTCRRLVDRDGLPL